MLPGVRFVISTTVSARFDSPTRNIFSELLSLNGPQDVHKPLILFTWMICLCIELWDWGCFQARRISRAVISSRVTSGGGGMSRPNFSTKTSLGVWQTCHARYKSLGTMMLVYMPLNLVTYLTRLVPTGLRQLGREPWRLAPSLGGWQLDKHQRRCRAAHTSQRHAPIDTDKRNLRGRAKKQWMFSTSF